jgi:hypothetical protein
MWIGIKPLILFLGATHYDTPRSLCVAAMGDAGLGDAPGCFELVAIVDLRCRPLVGVARLFR